MERTRFTGDQPVSVGELPAGPRRTLAWLPVGILLAVLLPLLLMPLTAIFVFAARDGLGDFVRVLSTADAQFALRFSILMAFATALVNGVLGTYAAYVLSKYEFPGREALNVVVNLPVAIPTVVVGTSLLLLWGPIGLLGQFLDPLGIQPMFAPAGVLLAHLFVTFPYVLGAFKPVLDELETTYEEAAYTIGANRWQTFRFVILPAGAPPHEEGAPVRILFRPETVLLQAEPFAIGEETWVLGQGTIQERTFAGSWQRLLITVDNLRGARLVTPRPTYGQNSAPIEVVQPSVTEPAADLAPGRPVWLGLRHYHVLNPAGLKVLVYAEASAAGEAAAEFGCRLAQAASGPITLLDLATTPDAIASVRQRLEQLGQSWQIRIPQVETHARLGGTKQIVLEAQEGGFEVVVMGRADDSDSATAGLGTIANRLLLETGISVLLVHLPRPRIHRILICTAVGEPGKSDVQFGGRIARHLGAEATVLHVHRPGITAAENRRIERHLAQARSSLTALRVDSVTKTVDGPITERILREAEDGDHDLIVIGAPAPPAQQQFFWPNLAVEVVAGTLRPVLVVPMLE